MKYFMADQAPGSWSSLRLKSKLIHPSFSLWLYTSKKWNAFKVCLYIMLKVINSKHNPMRSVHFINDWNLDLSLKMLHDPGVRSRVSILPTNTTLGPHKLNFFWEMAHTCWVGNSIYLNNIHVVMEHFMNDIGTNNV